MWLEAPTDFDSHSLAEFIEAELLFSQDDYLSVSEARALFSTGSQPTDEEFAFAMMEIERRATKWGAHYPYLVDDRGVYFDRGEHGSLYCFLLLLSIRGTPVRKYRDFARSDPIFDALVREAFRCEQGENAAALVFAWPPRDGRPRKFREAVAWVASELGVGVKGAERIPSHYNDAGVDVIVWRAFGDDRNGFHILLIQNTVQWEFRQKARDVSPYLWFDWLDIAKPPNVGFAVPFAIPRGDIWWQEVADGVDVVMDRGRLLSALTDEDPRTWAEWRDLCAFVDSQVEEIRRGVEIGADGKSPQVPRARKKSPRERSATP